VVVVEPGLIETGFGDVVADGLLKRSGSGGAYAKVTQAVAKTTRASYGHGRGSDPSVIAECVSAAISSARPRTRYAAGKYAKMMIGVRKWLGDRMFDRLILSQMR
ncbi:MAG: short-chain dehydrogenase/reductase, partial [Mesorhizobium sp.]|nr:short-chain dehydrogenase/reductase [Mesorhizobium sp.]